MIDYEIRPYEADDIEGVVDLHRYLSRGDRDHRRRYLEWKYQENPFIQPSIMMIAHLGGKVVGKRGTYGSSWQDVASGRPMVIPHADDLAIHPDHRNRGLFLPLMDALTEAAAQRGYPWIIGLSGGLTTQRLALATGWTSLGEIDRHLRPSLVGNVAGRLRRIRPIQRATALSRRMLGRTPPAPPLLPEDTEVDAVVRRITSPSGPVSRRDQNFIGELGSIADAAQPYGEPLLRASRDDRYMRWRLSNPGRTYRIISWDDGGSRGYMVLAWAKRDPTKVSVADFAFTDRDAFEGLLRALCAVKPLEILMMTARLPRELLDLLGELEFAPLLKTAPPSRMRKFLLVDTSRSVGDDSLDLRSTKLVDWDFNLLETMQV